MGATSDGINPLADAVSLQVGTYNVTIPAGSFHQLKNGSKSGSYVYSGTITGVSLDVQIVVLGGKSYQLKATGTPVDLTALTNPIQVAITVGNDTGNTPVIAGFD